MKIILAVLITVLALSGNCLACDCPKQEVRFVNYRVWDVVSGKGTIISINPNQKIPYPIMVELDSGIIRLYTIDGKNNTRDLLPSLYTYRVKIVKE